MGKPLRHLSLFSGSGIGDYAAEQCGIKTVAQCENDPCCLYCLEKMFPNAYHFKDVKDVSKRFLRLHALWPIDIISGGFPCQDISTAGRGTGIEGSRSGLWREMFRVIRQVRPTWIVIENVPAIRLRGVDRVIAPLERIGYTCWPLVVGAWAVGAPHKRDRVWIVGHAKGRREKATQQRGQRNGVVGTGGELADAEKQRQRKPDDKTGSVAWKDTRKSVGRGSHQLANADATGLQERLRFGCNDETQCASVVRSRWPSRPGQPQYDWEAPRTIDLRGIHPSVRAFLRKAGAPLVEQSQQVEAMQKRVAAAARDFFAEFSGAVGSTTDGMGFGVFGRTNKTLLRMAGNGWVYPLAILIYRWIVEVNNATDD